MEYAEPKARLPLGPTHSATGTGECEMADVTVLSVLSEITPPGLLSCTTSAIALPSAADRMLWRRKSASMGSISPLS